MDKTNIIKNTLISIEQLETYLFMFEEEINDLNNYPFDESFDEVLFQLSNFIETLGEKVERGG